jgi:hypothetical protein
LEIANSEENNNILPQSNQNSFIKIGNFIYIILIILIIDDENSENQN